MSKRQAQKPSASRVSSEFILDLKKVDDMENLAERITLDPEVCHGKPTIRGLRYPVENMLELMASGMTIEELLEDYPDLEREDFLACLHYASKLAHIKSIYRIASLNF
ncbi:hypothetical protein D770_14915 [Flammeovirgaceae bacterium 311]|nr:hypothetical protein D770_14915 [Flammeovirgaceae bacterium 311]